MNDKLEQLQRKAKVMCTRKIALCIDAARKAFTERGEGKASKH